MSTQKNAQELCQLIGEGQMMEGFEKFYDNDVTVIEANGETRQGKDAQRNAILQWQGMIKEFHGAGVEAITANEESQTAMVESWVDITMQDGNRMKMEEVAVQKWKNNKIVNERFYYNLPK